MVHKYCGSYLVPSLRVPGWEDSGYPHGTLMVASRACLNDIGLFDERYFAYCEEADLGERARRAGWQVGVVWGAVVHNPTMSSEVGVPEYLMVRNTLFLVRQHFGPLRAAVLFILTAWITLVGVIVPSRQTPYWHLRGRLLAMRDFLLGRTGPPPRW
ncbi:MAG: glycosyltransferase family 2 protein, partial [Acidimicrobiales bacterium]